MLVDVEGPDMLGVEAPARTVLGVPEMLFPLARWQRLPCASTSL